MELKRIGAAVAVVLLQAGCAIGPMKGLENVLTCVKGRPEAIVASKWQLFAIGTSLAEDQGRVICPVEPTGKQ